MDVNKISFVAPIGVLAPNCGTPLPKQHTGFVLNELGVPLLALGDLTITQIRKVTFSSSPTRPGYVDYAIFFSVRTEVTGHFGHVTELNPNLQPAASAYRCSTYSSVDETVESCSADTNIKVAAGIQIATSGTASHSAAIDMGMSDSKISDAYVNPTRYGKLGVVGTLCPWDFYSNPLKVQLYAKIGLNSALLITKNPKCGTVAVDRAGTAVGRWTPQSNPGNGADPADGNFLVLTPDIYNPETRVAFSTRIQQLAPITRYEPVSYPRFPLQAAGRVNLAPASISADGNIYCYVVESSSSTESFLLQLTAAAQLKIEHRAHAGGESTCNQPATSWAFSSNAVVLIR